MYYYCTNTASRVEPSLTHSLTHNRGGSIVIMNEKIIVYFNHTTQLKPTTVQTKLQRHSKKDTYTYNRKGLHTSKTLNNIFTSK